MDQFDHDVAELGEKVAFGLWYENDYHSRNERAREVVRRANSARFLAENRRISTADFGFGD